jgi:hypothetical protein
MEPAEAMAGMVAAMGEAARYAGGGLRTSGRRMRHRATDVATEGARRAAGAYGVLRGGTPAVRRRPADFVVVAVVAGATGAVVALAVRRLTVQWRAASEGEPGQVEDHDARAQATPSPTGHLHAVGKGMGGSNEPEPAARAEK